MFRLCTLYISHSVIFFAYKYLLLFKISRLAYEYLRRVFQASKPPVDDIEELEEIGEPRGEMGPNLYLASQLAQSKGDEEAQPVYSPYLGLAIEPLKEGFTLKSLFEVQSTS